MLICVALIIFSDYTVFHRVNTSQFVYSFFQFMNVQIACNTCILLLHTMLRMSFAQSPCAQVQEFFPHTSLKVEWLGHVICAL